MYVCMYVCGCCMVPVVRLALIFIQGRVEKTRLRKALVWSCGRTWKYRAAYFGLKVKADKATPMRRSSPTSTSVAAAELAPGPGSRLQTLAEQELRKLLCKNEGECASQEIMWTVYDGRCEKVANSATHSAYGRKLMVCWSFRKNKRRNSLTHMALNLYYGGL